MDFEQIAAVLRDISSTNAEYVSKRNQDVKSFSYKQTPVATLVMCCDSRAHTTSFTYNPENSYFIVRNIGNQYILNQGCVEFGVRVLQTPLLIFLGHTQCGAIEVSMGDYAGLPSSIIREVDHLALSIKKFKVNDNCRSFLDAVINNVNTQIELASKDFIDLLDAKKLIMIGMVMDLDDSLDGGHGKITIINVNGETNKDILLQNPLVRDFFV